MPPIDTSGVKRVGPTIAAGVALGSAAVPALVLNSDSSDDRGSLTFGTGTGQVAGVALTFTFAVPKDPNRLPVVNLTETTVAAAALNPAITAISATGFSVSVAAPAASQGNTVYGLQWSVID
jgi:hypothetical protein